MTRLSLVFGVLLAVTAVHAQGVKNLRDPFWPVGYKKPEPKPAVSVAEIVEPVKTNAIATIPVEPPKPDPLLMERVAAELQLKIRQNCNVGGFLKSGGKHMAYVNGQIKGVDDTLIIDVDGTSYRFKIKAITPMSIKIEPIE